MTPKAMGQSFAQIPTIWKIILILGAVFSAGAATNTVLSGQLAVPARVQQLEVSVRDLSLQVCLLRVEIRGGPTDPCAGFR